MPDYSGALKKFRSEGYPKEKEESGGDSPDSPSGVRVIKLTDDEAKELQPYQEKFGPGEEMVVEATGKLEGNSFRVMSVRYANGGGPDMDADAEEAMQKSGIPTMGSQSMPSPS